MKSKAIATGVIALTLLAATPVFADSNKSGDDGLHIGAFAQILRAERQDARQESRTEHKSATTTQQFTIDGMISGISGTMITVTGSHGAMYSVNAANASITGHENVALPFASLVVNHKVAVTGTLTNNVIVATKIKDKTDETSKPVKPAKTIRSISAGIVTAINGATVTFSNFGSAGNTTVTTNSATKYSVNGTDASSSALTVGSHVLILGTSTATSTTSVNASVILILTNGLNWIRHLWH